MIKHVSNLDIITVNRKLETAKELIRENTKRSLSKALSILRTISIWRSTEEQNKERNHLVKQIKQNLGAFAKVTSYKLMVKLGYELIEYTSTHILYVKEDAVKDKIYIRFDLLNQGVAKFNQDDKVLNILEMELPAINLFYSERKGKENDK